MNWSARAARGVGAFVFLALGLVLPVPSAVAEDTCNAKVVDAAGLYGADMSVVQAAVDNLESRGADVRVRTMKDYQGYANLDDWVNATRAACKGSWSNGQAVTQGGRDYQPGTLMKGNMVVLAMRQSNLPNQSAVMIFYGSSWKSALDGGVTDRVQADMINTYLRNGKWANGSAFALDKVGAAIDRKAQVPNAPAYPNAPSGNTTTNTYQAPDLSGLWVVLGGALGVGALGVAGFFGYGMLRRRREEENERQAARSRALSLRDSATTLLLDINTTEQNAVRTVKVKDLAAADGVVNGNPNDWLRQYDKAVANATVEISKAASSYSGPDDDKLTTVQYEGMAPYYSKAVQYAQEASELNGRINTAHAEYQKLVTGLPQAIDTLRQDYTALVTELTLFGSAGAPVAQLDTDVKTLGSKIDALGGQKPSGGLYREVQKVRKMLAGYADSFARIKKSRKDAEEGAAALPREIEEARHAIPAARAAFDRMVLDYPEDAWRAVRGNGTEAEKRFAAADALLEPIGQDLTSHKWDEAVANIEKARKFVRDGSGLLVAIAEREDNLAKAKRSSRSEVERVRVAIQRVADYEQRYDKDIRDSLKADIQHARDLLRQAEEMLGAPKVNYLKVVDKIVEADRAADAAYAECSTEHEAAERRRQQAEALLQQAEAESSKAGNFIHNHSGDVGGSALQSLESATKALYKAKATSNLSTRIEAASKAIEHAQAAYRAAKRDFEDAEEEREEARRRRRREQERSSYNSSVIYVDNSSHYGGSSWGSGSSWGGSDSGSGSSSSFSFGGFSGGDSGSGSSSSW